jgi:hypothetical protein
MPLMLITPKSTGTPSKVARLLEEIPDIRQKSALSDFSLMTFPPPSMKKLRKYTKLDHGRSRSESREGFRQIGMAASNSVADPTVRQSPALLLV